MIEDLFETLMLAPWEHLVVGSIVLVVEGNQKLGQTPARQD